MKQNQGPRRYRIGEYASYMGVTPDFLKHYEKKHIISADVQDSGYRYYRFRESCRILECMRLRNYGFTVRDMAEAVNCMDGDQAWQMLEEKAAAMEKQVELETAILEEHRRIRDWMQRIRGKGEDWVVQRMEPFYFLPHSHHNDFLKDPRIYDILNRWVSWMPVVKSTLQIQWDGSGEEEMNSAWGLLAGEAQVLRHGIPITEAVQRIPACKALVYSFAGREFDGGTEADRDRRHPVYQWAARLGLRPAGTVYKVMLMYARMEQAPRLQYGFYILPLEE